MRDGYFWHRIGALKAAQPPGKVVDAYVESRDFLYVSELICADAQSG